MKNDTKVTDTVMLGGLRNGQVRWGGGMEFVLIMNILLISG
jgi:hypothetical protein